MDPNLPHHDDHEAKMARADLYKLAQYSAKLFKLIEENEELDGWVQAKITKAADYISSVYHYMEYEKMTRNMIDSGPREFEESVQDKVKSNLQANWSAYKSNNKE